LSGKIEHHQGKEEAAYQAYCRARITLETLRGNVQGEELKISFFHDKLEIYENLIDLCLYRSGGVEEAFTYVEQAKSRSLMDLLLQPVHVSTEADAGQSELVRSIRNLREELNWSYNLLERYEVRSAVRFSEDNYRLAESIAELHTIRHTQHTY